MIRASRLQFVFLLVAACAANAQDPGSTGASVLTWQNDVARTGQNLLEGTLTYNTLSTSNFGQRCSAQLDGQVYAQPLVVTHIPDSNGQFQDVVFVVTQNDSLYAFNATPPTSGSCNVMTFNGNPPNPLAFLSTGATNGHSPVDCGNIGRKDCGTIAPKVGILGTPVIVLANHTATMYLVTYTQTGSGPYTYYHYLHVVDLKTFKETMTAAQIYPPGQLSGASVFSQAHIQRPGLLYANGYVYVTFSMMDGTLHPYPNGAVFAYNPTTLAEAGYFQTSAGQTNAEGAGIWQGGAGPSYGPDSVSGSSYLYLNTANGTFDLDQGGTNYGSSFIKLNATPDGNGNLTVAATFTPSNQHFRSDSSCPNGGSTPGDYDFGSGGVLLIPPHELKTPYLGVSGDKEGGIWFMNLANPGGFTGTDSCSSNAQNNNVEAWAVTGTLSVNGPTIHTNPAFWETTAGTNYLFIGPQTQASFTGSLLQYALCTTGQPINSTPPCSTNYLTGTDQNSQVVQFKYGATPSVSQNPNDGTDAIVWAIQGDGSQWKSTVVGRLYAFRATTMTYLYSSNACAGDGFQYPATKFSVPTVANGFVYVGAQGSSQNNYNSGMLYIFGGLSRHC